MGIVMHRIERSVSVKSAPLCHAEWVLSPLSSCVGILMDRLSQYQSEMTSPSLLYRCKPSVRM